MSGKFFFILYLRAYSTYIPSADSVKNVPPCYSAYTTLDGSLVLAMSENSQPY